MARQTSLQELLSQQSRSASNRPRRTKARPAPEDYDEDEAFRRAIEESLRDATATKTDNGYTPTPKKADQTSRDIAELESRPWQPNISQKSWSRNDQKETPEVPSRVDENNVGDNSGPDSSRRISIGRERSRSVQPISMTTTAASCLFNSSCPRRRPARQETTQSKGPVLEVMNSDHEEEDLEGLEIGHEMQRPGSPSATSDRPYTSQSPPSRVLHRRIAGALRPSQQRETCVTISPTPSPRAAVAVDLVSSDDDEHPAVNEAGGDDELSRDLSLDVFADKPASRKSGYPTSQDVIATQTHSAIDLLEIDAEDGTANMPWTISAERDVVLDTPQTKQRTRHYEMIQDSEEDDPSGDDVVILQEPWPRSRRRSSVFTKHLELPKIADSSSSGRRSILALASDTEDEPDIAGGPESQSRLPIRSSPRRDNQRQPSVIMLEDRRDIDHTFRLTKPKPLKLYGSQNGATDDSDMDQLVYQSQEDVVYGSMEFNPPSSLEDSEPRTQERIPTLAIAANNADEDRSGPLEQRHFSNDNLQPSKDQSTLIPSSSEAPHQSLKRKARELGTDDFAQFPHLSRPLRERRIAKDEHRDPTDDEDDSRRLKRYMETLRSSTKTSFCTPRQPPQQLTNTTKEDQQAESGSDADDEAQAGEKGEESEEDILVDARIRRRSFPSPAKKTRIDPPQNRFIIPPAATVPAQSGLVREETIESISTLTQSQYSGLPGSLGRDTVKSTLDDIELFSDDDPSVEDKDQEKKTRRYSALEFSDRPPALVVGRGSKSSSDGNIPDVRRESCPLCGEKILISELSSHVEREMAEQDRQEREKREKEDAEFAMAIGYQSQEDFTVVSDQFSSQIPDSSQDSLPSMNEAVERTQASSAFFINNYNNDRRIQSRPMVLTQAPSASQEVTLLSQPLRTTSSTVQAQQEFASEDSPSRRIQQLSLQSPPPNKFRSSSSSTPIASITSTYSASTKLPVRRGATGNGQSQLHQRQKPDSFDRDDNQQLHDASVVPNQNDNDYERLEINDSIHSSYSQMAFGIQPGQILPVDSDITTPTQSSYGGSGGSGSLSTRHIRKKKGGHCEDEITIDSQEDGEAEEVLSQVLAPISLDDRDTPSVEPTSAVAKVKDKDKQPVQDRIDVDDDDDDDFIHQPAAASLVNQPFRTTKPRGSSTNGSATITTITTAKKQRKERPTRLNNRKKVVELDSSDEGDEDAAVKQQAAAAPTTTKPRTRGTRTSATKTAPTASKKRSTVLDSILPPGVRRDSHSKNKNNSRGDKSAEAEGRESSRLTAFIVVASEGEDDEEFLESEILRNKGISATKGVREKFWHPEDDLSDSERLDRRQVMGVGVGGIVGGVGAVPGRVTMSRLVRQREEEAAEKTNDILPEQPRHLQQQGQPKPQSQELSTRAEYVGADGEVEYGFHSQEWWDEPQHGRDDRHPIRLDEDGHDIGHQGVRGDAGEDGDEYLSPLEDFEGLEGNGGNSAIAQFFAKFDATFQTSGSSGGEGSGKGTRRKASAGAATSESKEAAGGSSKRSVSTRRSRAKGTREGGNIHQMLFGRGVGPILDPNDPLTANFRSSTGREAAAAEISSSTSSRRTNATTANGSLAVNSTRTERQHWGAGRGRGAPRGRAWYAARARARRGK
ncbi:hypothetical protein BGW41_002312 [Actinomortierella wolfii]|nr:hypothetical protein BGW41_002312 [Actinomortierella wolfii]